MKQKLILWISVVALLVVVAFMVRDFFSSTEESSFNPYEYDLAKLKQVDPAQIGYKEVGQIFPEIEGLAGIAIDSDDNIYLAGDNEVKIYNAEHNLEKTISTSQKSRCIGVGENKVYLGAEGRIAIFDFDSNRQAVWNSVNEKSVITSIAVSKKFVYVADAGNRIVYQYDHSGKLISEIGRKDIGKGILGFKIPSPYFDLLLGHYGELWVVNPGRHRFERYNDNGELVSSWQRTSMGLDGFSGCCNPSNIAMLSNGSFVTSEKGIERIKIHQPTGDFLTVVAPPSLFKEGTTGIDLAVDSNDRIYVLDPVQGVIRIFELKENI
jgi:sugar lactone lactonase YvrE